MRGKDIEGMQRGLHLVGLRKKPRTGVYGLLTKRQVKKFQRRKGLTQDGVYGPRTHAQLSRKFDWLAKRLYMQSFPKPDKREIIAETAMLGYRKAYQIHYTQSTLRMWGVRNKTMPPNVPPYEDCSSFATWLYWVAKAPDPNGLGYSGFGFTGTQVLHGTRITSGMLKKGDLVFYGFTRSGYPTHVAIYVGGGKVVSHGSEGGPFLLPYNYRSINQIRTYPMS